MRLYRIALLGFALGAPLLAPPQAMAQVETREGIALQNQILQLRQEVETLRRGSGGQAPAAGTGSALGGAFGGSAPRAPATQPQGELVGQLLDRVSRLEEELRSVRGRAEQAEFRERELRERVEKLSGDIDFRLQQVEAARPGAAAPAARPSTTSTATTSPAATSPAATTPAVRAPTTTTPAQPPALTRPPQRALADGQAALTRRDFTGAEAAAREVLAARDTARAPDALILLGDALNGRRDHAGAAVAFDDAFRRNPQGGRAAEAMLGVANALISLNNNRDACGQLNDLRSRFPSVQGPVAQRVADARRRAQCR